MPLKLVKQRIIIWVHVDTINGYVSECHVYTAKEIVTKEGLGERVVNDLTRKLAGNNYKNYHIYCDIFYKLLTLSIPVKRWYLCAC